MQLALVNLTQWADRKVGELSGGMQQRVGLARAFVTQAPILLMDEPFSALDVLSAEALRGELLELWSSHAIPTKAILMVTHNIEEAVLMADRIVVMNKGVIEQVGSPLELYEHPCNLFVGGFIGSPRMNFINAEVVQASACEARVRLADGSLYAIDNARALKLATRSAQIDEELMTALERWETLGASA